jgi:hypothetical protein
MQAERNAAELFINAKKSDSDSAPLVGVGVHEFGARRWSLKLPWLTSPPFSSETLKFKSTNLDIAN